MSQRLSPRVLMYAVLAILVATGLSSTVGFKRIGALIAAQVASPETAHAHGRMATALDEQMQALLTLIERPLGEGERDALGRTAAVFDAELREAAAQERAEEFGLATVQKAWGVYRDQIRDILAADARPAPAVLAQALTSLSVLRRATNGFALRQKLDVSSLRAMIRRTARHYVLVAVGLTALGMVVALFFHYRFTRFVRSPIEKMTGFLRAGVGVGERLSVQGDAGIVELAQACNEHFEEVERRNEDRWAELRAERRIAEALMESMPEPTVLLNPAGDPVRANAAARDWLTSARGEDLRRELHRVAVDPQGETVSPLVAEIRPVKADGGFAGALVRLADVPPQP